MKYANFSTLTWCHIISDFIPDFQNASFGVHNTNLAEKLQKFQKKKNFKKKYDIRKFSNFPTLIWCHIISDFIWDFQNATFGVLNMILARK
jgi:hypothetical protein